MPNTKARPVADENRPEKDPIPPFAALRAFEAVGRLGGVRKAAQELGVDHAVVSRHLKGLESWLGAPLFDRGDAAPRLNSAGRAYQEVISAAIAAIAQGTRDVQRADGVQRIMLWCVPGFASRWLAANLDDFVQNNPGMEVELRPTDDSPDFTTQEADADIRWVRDIVDFSPAPGVAAVRFARPLVLPMASPDWIGANPKAEKPEDLLNLRLLHEENDEEWRGWFEAIGVRVGARLPGPRLWHAHLTLDAARRGQGVCLANPFLLADDVAQGLLAPVLPPRQASVEMGSYVLSVRSQAADQGAMRKFSEWIAARTAQFLKDG